MSLLDFGRKVGGGLLDIAQRLGEQRFDPLVSAEAEQAAGEFAPLLRQRYDQQFRANRAKALRGGARWYEMNDIAAAEAQDEHDRAMAAAVQSAEFLRQRREQSGRSEALRKLIEKKPAEQREILEAMDPSEASQLLAEQAFPKPDKDPFTFQQMGEGYVLKGNSADGSYEIIHDPKWAGDRRERQLALTRSEEGEDIVFRNPLTGEEINRVPGAASNKYKSTDASRQAAGFAGRMINAERNLPNYVPTMKEYAAFSKMGEPGTGFSEAALRAAMNKAGLSPQARSYFQYVSDWARSKLRKESGAVIALEEIVTELNTFFPIPGDESDPAILEQKRAARAIANDAMVMQAGDEWDRWLEKHPEHGDKPMTAAERAKKLREGK